MQIDKNKPFKNKQFLEEVIKKVRSLKFKLYGKINAKLISKDELEIDFNMGEVHMTEVDLLELSKRIKEINKKYKTNITYCLYHSDQFPGRMLLNIRGPKAPMLLSNKIKF